MVQLLDEYKGNVYMVTRMYSDCYYGRTESWWVRTNAQTLSSEDIKHIVHDVIGCTNAISKTDWEIRNHFGGSMYEHLTPFYSVQFVGENHPLDGHYEILIRQHTDD